MKIIAVVGMPGCGKSTMLDHMQSKGIPFFNMGDVVTKIEPEKRGIKQISEGIEHKIRTELREKLGPAAIAIRTAEEVKSRFKNEKVIAIGGIHSPAELNHFRKEFGNDFFIVCIDCSEKTRLERLKKRSHRPLDEKAFWHREEWEHSVGIDEAMRSANVHINNEGSKEALIKQTDAIIKGLGIQTA